MLCFWRTSDLAVLLIWGVFVAESSCMNGNQTSLNGSLPESEVNTTLFVQMGAKALLCCPALPMTKTILILWVITPRGQPPCRIIYRAETKHINETNCTDRRITWASTSDQRPDLQIDAVALDHDGLYSCDIATPTGNFLRSHDLHVLVPPAVTLFPGENRAAVCEAIAGKPAAQIFWTPDGDHITKKESHSNGTVTVRSTYHWEQNNVSVVFCFVSHPTGNQTLSIELNQGVTITLRSLLTILYVKLSLLVIILLILGFAFFQKNNYFRK
ncbi:cell surface glycoprotein CD200 receptor 1 isoform X4 [Alexandromys fortis]|uniref:cell surface glycoprotein CD200 receptor 1 isoform X4 n=1 Tax=Alexandromys fortis TaxID=100897 RepID=UPI0021538FF6|nr:cell surface glycoprotein CD200 receptor 1 isoform X4 [Microtus fortis]